MFNNWLKRELKITNTRVKKWLDWDPDGEGYEAFIDQRMVIIPRPIDAWSFLVALHEIGHISTGDRLYSYLSEYNAEKWAIRRAKDSYGIVCNEYEIDAKNYVKRHLISNLALSDLRIEKVKPYVLNWLGETVDTIREAVYEMKKELEAVA